MIISFEERRNMNTEEKMGSGNHIPVGLAVCKRAWRSKHVNHLHVPLRSYGIACLYHACCVIASWHVLVLCSLILGLSDFFLVSLRESKRLALRRSFFVCFVRLLFGGGGPGPGVVLDQFQLLCNWYSIAWVFLWSKLIPLEEWQLTIPKFDELAHH